jgi:hypothetical protein
MLDGNKHSYIIPARRKFIGQVLEVHDHSL